MTAATIPAPRTCPVEEARAAYAASDASLAAGDPLATPFNRAVVAAIAALWAVGIGLAVTGHALVVVAAVAVLLGAPLVVLVVVGLLVLHQAVTA